MRLWFALLGALLACGGAPTAQEARLNPAFDAGAAWVVDINARPDSAQHYAVGGTELQGMLWEGEDALTQSALPEALGDVPLLHWVHVLPGEDLVVVGKAGTILRRVAGAWQRQDAGTNEDLWGVWGAAEDDLWAVGGDGLHEGSATLLHFDGQAWSPYALPALKRPRVWAFYKVWGSSADDVYVVGQSGAVLHFDGREFSELGIGTSEDLISVFGTDKDRVAIVGGRSNGVLSVFDGTRFRTESLAPLPGLNGVWLDPHGRAFVAGIEGTVAEVDLTTFRAKTIPLATPSHLTLHAIHGGGQRLFAVGGNLGASVPPYRSITLSMALETAP
jgi:hypothetical protein